MAITTREQFIDYCLRRLGAPVIDINVDPEQVEDRVDDALEKFRDWHYDGTERVYYKIQVTQTDYNNKYFTLPEELVGVTRVFRMSSILSASGMFNVKYQMMLHNAAQIATMELSSYVMVMRHIEEIDALLSGEQAIRFTRHTNKLFIDTDWETNCAVDSYVILDAYQTLDPEVYTNIWDDPWLKSYASNLIKHQWANNMRKFVGMTMPGGLTFNADTMWTESHDALLDLEKQLTDTYGGLLTDLTG